MKVVPSASYIVGTGSSAAWGSTSALAVRPWLSRQAGAQQQAAIPEAQTSCAAPPHLHAREEAGVLLGVDAAAGVAVAVLQAGVARGVTPGGNLLTSRSSRTTAHGGLLAHQTMMAQCCSAAALPAAAFGML